MHGRAENADSNNNSPNMEDMKCNSVWLEQEMLKGHQMLIIDYRENEDFQRSHIKDALHIGPVPRILQKRFEKSMNIETLLKTEHKGKYNKHREGVIIVYDNEGFKLTLNNENFFTIFLRGLVDNGGKVHLLSGKFLLVLSASLSLGFVFFIYLSLLLNIVLTVFTFSALYFF